jgi:hypothetical protein
MLVHAIYLSVVLGNVLVIVAASTLRRRVTWLVRVAAAVSGVALLILVVPIFNLLVAASPPPGQWEAIRVLVLYSAPVAVELIMLAGVLFRVGAGG